MKKYIYPMALAATLLTTTGCSDDEVNDAPVIPDDQKEMISFSVSDEANSTRAGFLKAETSLAMRIQSDEKGGSGKRYTRTVAKAAVDASPTTTSYSTVSFDGAYVRYWDDAHGRKSLLSVYAVAVPNGGSSITNNGSTLEALLAKGDATKDWGTNATNTIAWQVNTSAQEKDASDVTTPTKNIDQEDLVYSNNIQAGGTDGVYRDYGDGNGYVPSATGDVTHKNGQMLFFQSGMTDTDAASKSLTDAPGHFDKGHLVFNHALSRITVTLVEGKGFDKTSNDKAKDFNFATDTNIKLLDMNVKGTLNIPIGEWTIPAKADGGIADIAKMAETGSGNYANTHTNYPNAKFYTLTAQMLPDYVFADGSTTNVMHFTIDGNEYFITQDMLYDALNVTDNQRADYGYDGTNSKFTMMQGKNYNFTLVVNKKQIEVITATLKAWDDVNAEYALDNTHISITTSRTGSEHNDEINLFKMEQDLGQIYTDDSYFDSAKGFTVFQGDYKKSGVADLKEMLDADNSDASFSPKQWYADGWYYKDNQTAYHLRSLNTLAADENSTTDAKDDNVTNTSNKSSFAMQNGAQSTQDYHWGAPMIQTTDDGFLKYSLTEGYSSSIHPGFVAPNNGTTKPINITELHMMSNINVVLKTTTTSDKINLRTGSGTNEDPYEYATVKITKLASKANVDMGTGLVTPSNTITAEETMTAPTDGTETHYFVQTTGDTPADDVTTTQAFTWAVVPQTLVRTGGTSTENMVGITITTPDNNTYYVVADLSTIIPSSIGSQVGQMHNTTDPITRWYPNHSYTYTFTLTKKGIEAITCTLAEWVTVIAKDQDIDLES